MNFFPEWNPKMIKKQFVLIFSAMLFGCSFSDSPADVSPLKGGYYYTYDNQVFATKALTQNYLKNKLAALLTTPVQSQKLVKEIYYANYKYPDFLKSIIAANPAMYTIINSDPVVLQKKTDPVFLAYINSINPYPTSVTAIAATNITQTTFTANWTGVSGATGYTVVVNGTTYDAGNATSFVVPNLTAGTNYSYIVRSYNGSGSSPDSNSISVTTGLPLPEAPVASNAILVAYSSFSAHWTASTNATGYTITLTNTDLGTSVNIDPGNNTSYNFTGLLSNTNYSYTVTANNSSGSSAASNAKTVKTLLITSGLLARYDFSGDATDSSGNNRNGTVTGATLASDRFNVANRAYSFGSGKYIELGTWFNYSNFTISLWVNQTSAPTGGDNLYDIIDNNHDLTRSWTVQSGGTNSSYAFLTFNTATGNVGANVSMSQNQWYHLVFVKDGTVQKVYRNNVLVDSKTVATTLTYDGTQKLGLGRWGGNNLRNFPGLIDDVVIYNRGLTTDEINSLYKR
jgi:hypothetical protein